MDGKTEQGKTNTVSTGSGAGDTGAGLEDELESPKAMAEEIISAAQNNYEEDPLLRLLGPTSQRTERVSEKQIMERPAMTKITSNYGFGAQLDLPFEQALEEVKAALKDEGFGILTEIDVKKTLKEKLDVDYGKYVILGACNPTLAYEALLAEPEIGLLLPCNVVVRRINGKSEVLIVDPTIFARVSGNPAVEAIAERAKVRLEKAIDELGRRQRPAA